MSQRYGMEKEPRPLAAEAPSARARGGVASLGTQNLRRAHAVSAHCAPAHHRRPFETVQSGAAGTGDRLPSRTLGPPRSGSAGRRHFFHSKRILSALLEGMCCKIPGNKPDKLLPMTKPRPVLFKWRHFAPEIILCAVRVSAILAVVSRRRGTPDRARSSGRPHERVALGAAVRARA